MTQLSNCLADHTAEEVLTGPSLFFEFDPEGITKFLDCLTPRNSRVRISAKGLAPRCTLKERWYGTEYGEEKMSEALIKRYEEAARVYGEVTAERLRASGGKPVTGGAAGLGLPADEAAPATATSSSSSATAAAAAR